MRQTYTDVPLPGLGLVVDDRAETSTRRPRRYDASLAPTAAAVERFWSHVVTAPGDGCWIWTGAISSPDGYGRITWRSGGASRTLSAHRFALVLAGNDDPDAVAEHRCNEPLCVRVDRGHVIRSTQTANLTYAVACGRAGAHRFDTAGRSRVDRSRAVRAALAHGWDAVAYACAAGETIPDPTPRLF